MENRISSFTRLAPEQPVAELLNPEHTLHEENTSGDVSDHIDVFLKEGELSEETRAALSHTRD